MDVFSLTRRLVDVESITGNEAGVGEVLLKELAALGFAAEKMAVPFPPETEPGGRERFNVYAESGPGRPQVVFTTHMDTVPPFIPSSEDADRIYGRGSCDAKGIIAAQIGAALRLKQAGIPIALLFVVGEERDSLGATEANGQPRGTRFLINGEPTENKLAIASKGSLWLDLEARGRMAHSAYPELGESAIEKLLTALERLRTMPLEQHAEYGPSTVNIGVIEGGRAPNVVPDRARAILQYRLVGPSEGLRARILAAVEGLAEARFPLEIPFVKLRTVEGVPTMMVAYTTDIPNLAAWGEPLLMGPGSIHTAHTEREFVEKRQLVEAVERYAEVARKLVG